MRIKWLVDCEVEIVGEDNSITEARAKGEEENVEIIGYGGKLAQLRFDDGCVSLAINSEWFKVCHNHWDEYDKHDDSQLGTRYVSVDLSSVHWKLLMQQKYDLIKLSHMDTNRQYENSVEGLLSLLDYIQDEAEKQLGAQTVFGHASHGL